ncbi:hypothetical protein AM1_5845 [Acaryochloris marina MBIC11017]|uniref:Uncharacterized protein n=1 Tax=Acaryochloris marina (strain MBIC 11017) TaxID=329726 RepID=B0C0J3_ACAM1|nr:hypothetical protein AM1_5845 [Acaryochloris marina MBIC11017]
MNLTEIILVMSFKLLIKTERFSHPAILWIPMQLRQYPSQLN